MGSKDLILENGAAESAVPDNEHTSGALGWETLGQLLNPLEWGKNEADQRQERLVNVLEHLRKPKEEGGFGADVIGIGDQHELLLPNDLVHASRSMNWGDSPLHVAVEYPPYMEFFLAAHRNHDITDQEMKKALDDFLDHKVISDFKPKIAGLNQQIVEMQNEGIVVHAINSRHAGDDSIPNDTRNAFNQLRASGKYVDAEKSFSVISKGQTQGLLHDVITAQLLDGYIGINGKALLVYGQDHFIGTGTCDDHNTAGVLDDSLKAMGHKIVTISAYEREKDIRIDSQIRQRLHYPSENFNCTSETNNTGFVFPDGRIGLTETQENNSSTTVWNNDEQIKKFRLKGKDPSDDNAPTAEARFGMDALMGRAPPRSSLKGTSIIAPETINQLAIPSLSDDNPDKKHATTQRKSIIPSPMHP